MREALTNVLGDKTVSVPGLEDVFRNQNHIGPVVTIERIPCSSTAFKSTIGFADFQTGKFRSSGP